MNNTRIIFSLLLLTALSSCTSADFTNPETVAKNYRKLCFDGEHAKAYEYYLSAESKKTGTSEKYVRMQEAGCLKLKGKVVLERHFSPVQVGSNSTENRKLMMEEKAVSGSDTVYTTGYYTLHNEDNSWKIVWADAAFETAKKTYEEGQYASSRKAFEKVTRLDPFYGKAYDYLGFSYIDDPSLSKEEKVKGALQQINYALYVESELPFHYLALARYYALLGTSHLTLSAYQKGLAFCRNADDKPLFLVGTAEEYLLQREENKTEYALKEALKILNRPGGDKQGPVITNVWYLYGSLREFQLNYTDAIKYYKKALEDPEMSKPKQATLYFSYANCCDIRGLCPESKRFFKKAQDLMPGNNAYKNAADRVMKCQ